jgi:hypothetical protein
VYVRGAPSQVICSFSTCVSPHFLQVYSLLSCPPSFTWFSIKGDPNFDAPAKLAASVETHRDLLARDSDGVIPRLGIGGDYGFEVTNATL